ncbi:response regulator transcription factor [Rubellicoccus peritrichatus]|uniref:Response regulator transcription factor n=1 Tax=Rubellicoccus peritrichatus TaxID=3080537 RepID=A0AAQ3QUA2_9BACT|nr:response regulator transcription factor [Puniceicoccus sp. CR14]WOO39437.1 response regulator transcription factor [Puniceicoccus sp. CR14]
MKILIVEDNDRLRKSLLDYIRDEGYAADAAANGEEGLYKALNWDYDLIVLDVMLPKLDGWQVMEELRKSNRDMPVIMLTARDQVADRVKGLNFGADDYMVKPFEMDELIARIGAVLRRNKGTVNPLIKVGTIEMNTAARTVHNNGQLQQITAREYALLEILMTHQGEVVSRDYIYEHLFDERDESISNMLDVYIYKLRQKFGKNYLQTRRGMGYIFAA